MDCDNATISIAWSSVPGAVRYMATLEEIDGGTTCCTTPGTGCQINDLPCGQTYILHVTAEGRTCNSTQSEGDITRTGTAEIIILFLRIYGLSSVAPYCAASNPAFCNETFACNM